MLLKNTAKTDRKKIKIKIKLLPTYYKLHLEQHQFIHEISRSLRQKHS
jgi:hypothetical protein